MGKALITANKGAGLYSIKILYENAILIERKKRTEELIAEYTVEKVNLESTLSQQEMALSGLLNVLDSAIITGDKDSINTAQSNVNTQRNEIDKTNLILNPLIATIVILNSDLKVLTELEAKYVTNGSIDAWCVEYNETLTGNVDTIELSDENNKPNNQAVLISPTALTTVRKLTPVVSIDDWSFMYMLMATPVHQYHRPEYRYATLSEIDYTADTATITIIDRVSGIQHNGKQYAINKSNKFTKTPIQYQTCNSSVFVNEDIVVVAFDRNNTAPVIVGFVNNPRLCETVGFIYNDNTGTRLINTNQNGLSSLSPNINNFVAGQYYWSNTIAHITFSTSEGVFSGGVLVYNPSDNIVGCCAKKVNNETVLLLFTTIPTLAVKNIKYEFYNVTTNTVLSSAVLFTYDKLYQKAVPINFSATRARFLSLSVAEAAISGTVASIINVQIDFVNSSCQVLSNTRNEQLVSDDVTTTTVTIPPLTGTTTTTQTNNKNFSGELVFSVGYDGNLETSGSFVHEDLNSTIATKEQGIDSPPLDFPAGVSKIIDSSTVGNKTYSIFGNIETENRNTTSHIELNNFGNIVSRSDTGLPIIRVDRIKILDPNSKTYFISRSIDMSADGSIPTTYLNEIVIQGIRSSVV